MQDRETGAIIPHLLFSVQPPEVFYCSGSDRHHFDFIVTLRVPTWPKLKVRRRRRRREGRERLWQPDSVDHLHHDMWKDASLHIRSSFIEGKLSLLMNITECGEALIYHKLNQKSYMRGYTN